MLLLSGDVLLLFNPLLIDYSGKNAAAIFLTFVAAAIIVFIGMLFFTLIEQMVTFIASVAQEMIRRL